MSRTLLSDEIVTFTRTRDYRVVRELSEGACGKTVLLHDDLIDEDFVCKKYKPYCEAERSTLFGTFVREVKLLHRLLHPNIVRIFNWYLYPNDFSGFILMEYIDGTDVGQYLSTAPDKAIDVFRQTVSAFAHLERNGILHRDIRPENLMGNRSRHCGSPGRYPVKPGGSVHGSRLDMGGY